MAPAEFHTMTVTAEVRSPREVVLLLDGQPIGTCKIKVRIALACWIKGVFAKSCSKPRLW